MKIISYLMMIVGFLGWLSLYVLTIIFKDNVNIDNILFITGYIFIIIFIGGYLIYAKLRKKAKESR